MSRSSLNTLTDTNISTNGSSANTGALVNAVVKQLITEAQLAEDLVLDNQNGSILLTNEGRGLFFGTDTAKTGTITVDSTGALVGAVAWVIHNDASEPTITGATKSNFTYNASQTNYIKIVATKVGGTIIALASTPFAGDSKSISSGTGTPEGNKTANVGSIYLRTDGDQDTIVYEKVSGTGNTGWLSSADRQAFIAITDGATLTWNVRATDGTGRKSAYVTLGGNRTLAEPVNAKDGDKLRFHIYQDATGGRTITWPTKFEFKGTSELRTDASGFDILDIVYDATKDKYYCTWPIPRGYREYMILPGASDIDLDMDALTTREILDYDGKTIYLNNLNSTGGGSLFELPSLSKVPFGYTIPVIMEQSSSGGELECRVSGSDLMYLTGIGSNEFPLLDISGTDTIKLPDNHLAITRFMLVVRDSTGSSFKSWGIVDYTYTQTGYTEISPSTTTVLTRQTHGYKIRISPAGAFTLSAPTGYNEGEEIEVIINQGGTGYYVTPGTGWKVPVASGTSWPLAGANEDFKITATFQGSGIWFADLFGVDAYQNPA